VFTNKDLLFSEMRQLHKAAKKMLFPYETDVFSSSIPLAAGE
jgi:hypothetical protein